MGKELPKARARKDKDAAKAAWVPPATLEGAMRSLYRSYNQAFDRWATVLAVHGEMPPVFIVVCPNTAVSKLVYEWIAGTDVQDPDGIVRAKKGQLELLSNVDEDGRYIAKPRTILVDSAQLQSGEAMKQDFKDATSPSCPPSMCEPCPSGPICASNSRSWPAIGWSYSTSR